MKFNDFFKPRWKNSDPKIRSEAIKELTEEYHLKDLKDIAINDIKIENQKVVIDPKTPRLGDFDTPVNTALKKAVFKFGKAGNQAGRAGPEMKAGRPASVFLACYPDK